MKRTIANEFNQSEVKSRLAMMFRGNSHIASCQILKRRPEGKECNKCEIDSGAI